MNRKTLSFLFVFLCLMATSFAWFNTSYASRFPIDCSSVTAGTPIIVNGTSGLTLNGTKQTIWTQCGAANLSVYFNSNTAYIVANDSAQVPMYIESGNVSSYNPSSIFTNARAVYPMKDATDIMNNYNLTTFTGTAANGFLGQGGIFTNTQYAAVASDMAITGATSITMSVWLNATSINADGSHGAILLMHSSTNSYIYNSLLARYPYCAGGGTTACAYRQPYGIGDIYANSLYTVPTNTWEKYTYRYNSATGNLSIFVNGTLKGSIADSRTGSTGAANVFDINYDNGRGDMSKQDATYDQVEVYNVAQSDAYISQRFNNEVGTSGYGTAGAQENNAPPSSATINATLISPASGFNSTNTSIPLVYSVNFTNYSSVRAILYINGTIYANNTTSSNTTFTFPFTADYNSYSWYVFAYNASDITQNATSATNTFNVFYLLTATQLTPPTGATQQNKTIFFTYDANSTLPSNINTTLYLDGVAILSNISAGNATYNNSYTTTFGVHSWFVEVKDATNASRNNTTGNSTVEVNFAVTATSPASGSALAGNTATLIYSTSNLHPINCTTYIDGVAVYNQIVASSSVINTSQTVANGSHYWLTSCAGDDAPSYTQNTTNRTFTINFFSFNTQANLTATPENVLESPQALFFDINGDLNVLYFTDEGATRTVRVKTISGTNITAQANLTLETTAQFFIVFRNPANTTILTLNATNSTKAILLTLTGNALTQANLTFSSENVLNLTNYDAYTYANTKAFTTLNPTASSFWVFTTPIATGSVITKFNGTAFSTVQTFANSARPTWQTIANDSALAQWLYLLPVDIGGGNVKVQINSYDGTTITNGSTIIANASGLGLNTSMGGFEKYGNSTYAYITNTTSQTTIYLIEDNKTYQINESISNPSHFLFTDEDTFIFFALSGGDTFAYTCYFAGTPSCEKFASNEYGVAVPYEQGFMSSAKRESNRDDTVVRGMIQSGAIVQLDYNINTYDMKFICYDEQTDARKTFIQKTFTETSSTDLLNYTWGYVLPSASVGTGTKKYYSTCLNGTQRLFISGLAGNFSADEYSLLTTEGVYYSFTIKDRYGVAIEGVKVSMLRFSTLKQAFVVIEQCLSDFNGGCTFFLEPYTPYKILIEATGYTTQYVDFTPSSVTSIDIAMDISGTSFSLPNYNYLFDDLTTSLTPTATLMHNETNITFTTSSNGSILEYYGMQVWQTYNGTRSLVYSNNITTQATGGSVLYPVNSTGRYDVQVFAKVQNFTLYEPFTHTFVFQNKSGLVKTRDALTDNDSLSGWGLYFLGVIITMVVVGFVSRYTIDGAGVVGLIILWGFTLLDPSAALYTAGSIVITTTIATIITSIGVFAALYLRYSSQTGG